MKIIGIQAEGKGTNDQIRGVILEGCADTGSVPVTREALLKAEDERLLHPKNFSSKQDFANAVQKSVDTFLQNETAPEFVVLPVDHSKLKEGENGCVDELSYAVKNAFKQHGVAVKTLAITSNLYDYQYVDLIHVGKHQLSDADEKKLATNPQLKSKVVETVGTPGSLSWLRIRTEANEEKRKAVLDKYQGKKNVLFSLGGKTENEAIKFTIKDAMNLYMTAKELIKQGYNVIFTNSPRTPNDVSDYLFEKCAEFNENRRKYHKSGEELLCMDFYNSKKIAATEEEKKNFRVYDGRHNDEFAQTLKETNGNIYPAVLSVCEFVVNTHDSFSYTSDAAALGIPSVVYTGNAIDDTRPDCHKLFKICQEKGHVIDLDDALETIKAGNKVKTKPMDNVAKQLLSAIHRCADKSLTRTATRRQGAEYN